MTNIQVERSKLVYEEIHDEYITELVFKNGVKIHEPQYDHDTINICEED